MILIAHQSGSAVGAMISSKIRKGRHPPTLWERHRDLIVELYQGQLKSLSDIVAILDKQCELRVSKDALKMKMSRWKVSRKRPDLGAGFREPSLPSHWSGFEVLTESLKAGVPIYQKNTPAEPLDISLGGTGGFPKVNHPNTINPELGVMGTNVEARAHEVTEPIGTHSPSRDAGLEADEKPVTEMGSVIDEDSRESSSTSLKKEEVKGLQKHVLECLYGRGRDAFDSDSRFTVHGPCPSSQPRFCLL